MKCKHLVLDAGPLLSLSPLRGLAETYLTVPQILDELKDKRARQHFLDLGLASGVQVQVRNPDPASLAHVIQCAKKTGDYAVLSHADICVLALTHTLTLDRASDAHPSHPGGDDIDNLSRSTMDLSIEPVPETQDQASQAPLYDDPSDDASEEWITPDNVALHKSRALDLLPLSDCDSKKRRRATDKEVVLAGCMTADFAMQNVLLQMGLSLIDTQGKRIQKIKTWVLRCHACFKICKDNSKQFCPSCGNPTLLRASVTLSSPDAPSDAPVMELHLKKNFQYRLRGTKYSIPAPRPGSAKTGPGEGLILREDQLEYMRAKKRADGKRARDDQRMLKSLVERGGESGVAVGSWSDPDWIPGILGGSTSGRSGARDGMPQIGYGRRNPNEKKKH